MVLECQELRLSAKEHHNSAAKVIAGLFPYMAAVPQEVSSKQTGNTAFLLLRSYWLVQNSKKKRKKATVKELSGPTHNLDYGREN